MQTLFSIQFLVYFQFAFSLQIWTVFIEEMNLGLVEVLKFSQKSLLKEFL